MLSNDDNKNPGWKAGEWAMLALVVSDRYSLKKYCRHKGGRYGSIRFFTLQEIVQRAYLALIIVI